MQPCVYVDAAPTAFRSGNLSAHASTIADPVAAYSADNPTVEEQLAEAREEIRRLQGQIDRLTQERANHDYSDPSSSASASDDPSLARETTLPSLFTPRAGRVPIPSFPLGPGNPYSCSYANNPYYEPRQATPYEYYSSQQQTPYVPSQEPVPFAQAMSLPVFQSQHPLPPRPQLRHQTWQAPYARHHTHPPSPTVPQPYDLPHATPTSTLPYPSQTASTARYHQQPTDPSEAGAVAGPSAAPLPYYASPLTAPPQNFTTLEQAVVPAPQPRATYVYAADSTPTPTRTALQPVATSRLEDVDDGTEHWTGQVPFFGYGQSSNSHGGGTWAPPRVKEEPNE